MLSAAAWLLFGLGIGHTVTGLVWFRRQFSDAVRAGVVGQFQGLPPRRLAFWFTVFGPLLALAGHVALHAANAGDRGLLRIVGFYVLAIGMAGAAALPRSPFWAALLLSPVLIAGGWGWLS